MELKMFYMQGCPYCKMAKKIMEELNSDEKYKGVSVREIDENVETEEASKHDYWNVPSFFLGDEKLYEAKNTHSEEFMREEIIKVYERALKA